MHRIQKRFEELSDQAQIVVESMTQRQESRERRVRFGREIAYDQVTVYSMDTETAARWEVSAKSLLFRVFGGDDPVYQDFDSRTRAKYSYHQNRFRDLKAVFDSAKEQYEGGFLFDLKKLVNAQVFDDELHLAEHYLQNGHKVASVVTTGVVLETTIRKLCVSNVEPIAIVDSKGRPVQTDTLISSLRKADIYDESTAKQLRAWMGLRNDAAHGNKKNEEFENRDIERMIEGVRDFIASQMK